VKETAYHYDAETPGCQTAEVVLPGGTGKINVTIDYEYDDLNRITSAIYTDAENTGAAVTKPSSSKLAQYVNGTPAYYWQSKKTHSSG
jgi:hypothetical protein